MEKDESQFKDELQFTVLEPDKKFGLYFQGKFLYWDLRFDRPLIFLHRAKRRISSFLNVVCFLAGIAGLFSSAAWVYLNLAKIAADGTVGLFFWRQPSPLVLSFAVSLFFDMFLVYRLSEQRAGRDRLKRFAAKKSALRRRSAAAVQVPSLDISRAFSDETREILDDAYLEAVKFKQPEITPLHLFWALFKNKKIRLIFVRLNINQRSLLEKLARHLNEGSGAAPTGLGLSADTQKIMMEAYLDAYSSEQKAVDPYNIILYCFRASAILGEILYDEEVTDNKIVNSVAWMRTNEKIVANYKIYRKMARLKPGTSMNRAYTALATPTLDHFSRDLTLMAKYGYFEICLARDKEIKAVFEALESGRSGVLLVGPVGVGKTTIIQGVAQLMVKEEVPKFLEDKRLVEVDVARLIGGTTPAEAQDRLLTIINESVRARNVILYLKNLETVVGISSGAAGSLDLSEVLADAVSRRLIICLATATNENYTKYIEKRPLGNAFMAVSVAEPDNDQAIQILESKAGYFEGRYGIFFDYNAIEQAVNLSGHYITDEYLPAKAVNILQLAAVKAGQACKDDPHKCFCTCDDISRVISEKTGIPVDKVSASETQKLLNLESDIHRRMIGQEEAVDAISGSLRRARAEMRENKRPIASFLFLGPTGVGKTELAKSVAEVYFGDENCMIRLDMSEYQLADSVTKMIGGAQTPGYLTEAVRQKPFSLVLLDEIEKAHPDVLNLFLQMMDDGRLTDGQGRTINFTNSIIVATSNAGALYIEEAVGQGTDINIIKQELIDNQLNKIMRPELINRFDGIIVFKPLAFDDVVAITKLMLAKIAQSLEDKGIGFSPTEDGIKRLAQLGYDPKFGARPLRRLLQDKIENEIANFVLSGQLKRRDTIIINENGEIEVVRGRKL